MREQCVPGVPPLSHRTPGNKATIGPQFISYAKNPTCSIMVTVLLMELQLMALDLIGI